MIKLTSEAESLVGNLRLFQERLVRLDTSVCLDKVEDRLKRMHFWDDDEARQAREDFVRFAALTYLRPDSEIIPTKKIDEFWHAFIIYTQMYKEWCDKNWDERFFHHVPGHKGDGSWEMTRDLARRIYGVDWQDSAQALSCGCNIPNPRPAAVPRD